MTDGAPRGRGTSWIRPKKTDHGGPGGHWPEPSRGGIEAKARWEQVPWRVGGERKTGRDNSALKTGGGVWALEEKRDHERLFF